MTNELLWPTEYRLWLMDKVKKVIKKMSYNEISNILVNSVVLPNKPLSNLEIINAAERLSLNDLEGYFERHSS